MKPRPNIQRVDPRAKHPDLHDSPEPIAPEHAHLRLLASLVDLVKPDTVLELGTGNGHSAYALAQALKANGVGELLTVDSHSKRASVAARRLRDLPARVFLGDYRGPQFAHELANIAPVDLAHIDADWNAREEEVALVASHLAPNGVVVMHDMGAESPGYATLAAFERDWNVVRFMTPHGTVVMQARPWKSG